jgi:ribonuclease BN (tRNA processing enzyme)
MRLQFIGSGDAFGSGGRFNTCFHLRGVNANFLVDCGASSLIALKKFDVDINQIQTIFFTHFHADHFGGIPFFMLESQFFSKRTQPLTLVGPKGIAQWYERVMEISFPGSSKTQAKFDLIFKEVEPDQSYQINDVDVMPFQAHHGNPGGPFLSLRLGCDSKLFTYSGDTEWTEELVKAAKDVDLFVAEAYFYEKKIKFHLDLKTLVENLQKLNVRQLVLTHMSKDMLERIGGLSYLTADDGMVLDF